MVLIKQLQKEIEELEQQLKDRMNALPAHSIRPHQLLLVEELEEEIQQKKILLENLRQDKN